MRLVLVAAALAMCSAAPVSARQTRDAPDGHVPPPATIAQAEWLIGDWAGTGFAGDAAAETWLPPSGGTMVGVFVQEKPDGSLFFTEHMYLAEDEGSLVLKLKHFDPDLTGWEEKGEMVRFPLLSIAPCEAYFDRLTYRCDGDGGLLVAVQIRGEGDALEELVFRYKRRD